MVKKHYMKQKIYIKQHNKIYNLQYNVMKINIKNIHNQI